MRDYLDHPTEVYEYLRRLHEHELTTEQREQLRAHFRDRSGETPWPIYPGEETWQDYCQEEGLIEFVENGRRELTAKHLAGDA